MILDVLPNWQLQKHSISTYFLNVSFLLHENDLFWYIITNMEYEILNELENDSI